MTSSKDFSLMRSSPKIDPPLSAGLALANTAAGREATYRPDDGVRSREVVAEDVVELTVSERDEHRLVLLLHELAHEIGKAVGAEVLGIRRLHGLEDSAAVGKQMRDDVRMLDARVFRLDMEESTS